MPCVHCASRDTALAAGTSSRCSSSVPVQRVFQWERSYKQLRRQLRRSRTAVQRAFLQALFPTQPLSLASGLLFGPVQVRTCYMLGCT